MSNTILLNGVWDFYINYKKKKINVPANWYLEGYDYAGKAIYEKEFNLVKNNKKKYFLIFEGVDYFTFVYLNGKFIGEHEGYFQKFKFDITKELVNGKNKLKVVVNSPKESKKIWPNKKILIKGIFNHHDARPGGWSKEYGQDKNTGGIWNDVYIKETNSILIDNVKINSFRKANEWSINSDIFIENYTYKIQKYKIVIKVTPFNFKGKNISVKREVILYPGKNKINISFDFKNPVLWWTWDLGKPNLYKFMYEIYEKNAKIDEFSQITGIREFKKEKDNCWYLNGRRIFLRGTNIIPAQWLSEYSLTKIKQDIKMIKDANINIVRVHAHVNRKELYEELDKEGVMAWQDFALQWGYSTSSEFMDNAIRQLKDMINQFYNHPSIVIWCCHNEPFVNEEQLDPILEKKAREEDPLRHIEKSSNFRQHPYPGWYADNTPYVFDALFENAKKDFIITEYGAQSLPDIKTMKKIFNEKELFPPDFKKWAYHNFQYTQTFSIAKVSMGKSINEFINNSQEYQADLIKELTEIFRQKKYKYLNGIFQFMFVDCWPSITWSVVDYYRNPKKGYFALKTSFQPILPIYSMMVKTIEKGSLVGFGLIWKLISIINDYHYDLKNVKIVFSVRDVDGKIYFKKSRNIKLIKADSITHPFKDDKEPEDFTGDKFFIPENVKAGKHKIEIVLFKNNKKISENYYYLNIIKKSKKNG